MTAMLWIIMTPSVLALMLFGTDWLDRRRSATDDRAVRHHLVTTKALARVSRGERP